MMDTFTVATADSGIEATPSPGSRPGRALGAVWQNAPVLLFYGTLLALWEVASRLGLISAFLLPPPTTILDAIRNNQPELLRNAGTTLWVILNGFAFGALVGFTGGVAIFYSKVLRQILYPAALLTQTVPKVALAPVFIVWFGVGFTPIFAITALICLFPVLINTIVGLESIDPALIDLSRSVSATEWQRFRYLRFPAALPSLMAGLEVSITLAVVGALVGEFVAANAGLGYQILIANSLMRTPELFAALVVVVFLGIVLFALTRGLGRLVLRRRRSLPGAPAAGTA